ncbi:hypothetical protein DH2020_026789 [Rehmannia glutinosa]|uniref:BHLH domain-containing protein n=1 Tax=Rehmannia glutinosa TaxID=99300 RepID=A0ABR0VVZ9_REHGL
MPLSEFLRMASGKIESGQQKPLPANLSSRSDNELVELVWENGQIMMQGQSSRVTRSPALNTLPSNTHKARDPSRIGKFGGVESILNDMSPVVPSGDLDLSQDDELVPWLNYPIDDALGQDYGSVLLPEISGVTAANGMSAQNSFVSVDRRSSCEQNVSNLHSKASSSKARLLCSWPPQHRQTSDVLGSGVSDIVSNNTSNVVFGNSAQGRDVLNDSMSMKMERQNIGQSSNSNSSYLNFSHFARPANLVKANLPTSDGIPTSVLSGVEKKEVKEKNKSTFIERFDSAQKDNDFRVSSANVAIVNSRQPVVNEHKDSCPPERTENLGQEMSVKNDKSLIISNTADSTKGVPYGERVVEPMVASSSVGSGNSADRVSCEQTHNSKRKFRDTEESECRSDDIETESVGVKKRLMLEVVDQREAEQQKCIIFQKGDRINEKMRALQELIPNCNKADKASMLDEAIEYLKTLQLQVQIMSMGGGLCMPQMMFPTGMQHMHPAHIPHFSPMGVGMGMGMGFGMGMLDMHGGSPIFPVPPLQAPHFPSSMPTNFQRMPGPNLPVYGHPGQGLPNSVPRTPFVPLTGQPPVTSAMGSHNAVPSTSPILNSGDPMTNTSSQLKGNAEAGSSINQKTNQLQATNEVLNQSAATQENKQPAGASGPATLTSTTSTDISKEPGFD